MGGGGAGAWQSVMTNPGPCGGVGGRGLLIRPSLRQDCGVFLPFFGGGEG